MKKICFLGCGNLVNSILSGFQDSSSFNNFEYYFYTPSLEKARSCARKFSGTFVEDLNDLPMADIFVFGFKPQNFSKALVDYRERIPKGAEIWSLLAGFSSQKIQEHFSYQSILRIMPNTCSKVGAGISLFVTKNSQNLDSFKTIFGSVSLIYKVKDDDQLDLITGVTGSGSALLYEFLQSKIEFLSKNGVSTTDAEQLVRQLLLGSAKLYNEKSLLELQKEITSKKGVTERALESLREDNLSELVGKSLRLAYQRSKELSSS